MDPVTLSVIAGIIGSIASVLIKYEPEIAAICKEVSLLLTKGDTMTPEDLVQLQTYTDQLMEKLRAAEEKRLSEDAPTTEVPDAKNIPAENTDGAPV